MYVIDLRLGHAPERDQCENPRRCEHESIGALCPVDAGGWRGGHFRCDVEDAPIGAGVRNRQGTDQLCEAALTQPDAAAAVETIAAAAIAIASFLAGGAAGAGVVAFTWRAWWDHDWRRRRGRK